MSSKIVPLSFEPLSSAASGAFWHALCAKKLDELRLSEAPVPFVALYAAAAHDSAPPVSYLWHLQKKNCTVYIHYVFVEIVVGCRCVRRRTDCSAATCFCARRACQREFNGKICVN